MGASAQTTVYTVALSGSYTASSAGLAISPGVAQYGPTAVGQQGLTQQFTLTNSTAKAYTLSVNLPRQYVLAGAPCTAVAAGQSCSFSVAFLPLTNGDIAGTILAQATANDGSGGLTSIAYVEGYGVGAGTLTLTGGLIVNQVYNFGQVASGQTAAQVFTLTNGNAAGLPAITVRRVTSGPPFLSTTTCGAALQRGQACSVTVTYTPSNQVAIGSAAPATTSDAGTLTVESDAASSPMVVYLTGQAGPVAVANPSDSAVLATFTLSEGSLTFGSTEVGDASAAQALTLTNTGTQAIHISALTATTDFSIQSGCATVTAGASCTVTVTSTPQASTTQTAGTHAAALAISSDAATSLEFVSLLSTATASPLVITPASYDFGSLKVGASSVLPVEVTNTGAAPIVFGSITASGDYSVAGSCPASGGTLAGNSSCTVQVTFAPAATGTRAGTLALTSSASTIPLTVALTGVGTQSKLLVTPSSLAFGSVAVGYFANLQLTLMNTGSAALTNIGLSISGDYVVSIGCGTILAPGASCVVQVTFTPSAAGGRAGALTVTSSDASSPSVVPLTGTGIAVGGSFLLSVASASASVVSGQPATYNLTVTPTGGFAGTVALTCTPVVGAEYASCSLLPPNVTLANGAQSSVVTINTVTSVAALDGPNRAISGTFFCLLGPCVFLVWKDRKKLRKHRLLLAALFFCSSMMLSTGCGGKADSSIRYSPAGSYQFLISASSTSGVPITQTLTISLAVTATLGWTPLPLFSCKIFKR